MTDACHPHQTAEFTVPSNQRFWVHEKSRLWRITRGRWFADEAVRDGFKEVTFYQLEAFMAATQLASDNGWHPGVSKPFQSFLPAFQENTR